ncbi:winged helix-turn-helix domain-containing protein [Nannocystaceae bacterium ST9]
MTFLEAAIEILRNERDPLHFAEITKRAVDRKLLSHVGRDPETAMQTCLNSAVRNNTYDGLLLRDSPGHFQLRPGAALPELPLPPSARAQTLAMPVIDTPADKPRRSAAADKPKDSAGSRESSSKPHKLSASGAGGSGGRGGRGEGGRSEAGGGSDGGGRRKRGSKKVARPVVVERAAGRSKKVGSRMPVAAPVEVDEVEVDEVEDEIEIDPIEAESEDPDEPEDSDEPEDPDEPEASDEPEAERGFAVVSGQMPNLPPMPALDPSKIRFRGPQGSGLEGDTDIALVMANAVSRLVEERPELREELEAMQRPTQPEVVEVRSIEVRTKRREERRDDRPHDRPHDRPPAPGPDRRDKDTSVALDDDRGGRRRRRRRRRPRRVEWSEGGSIRANGAGNEELLDKVALLLADAGSRSLHVRQIAEHLASQNVLGGEISEIERAVTAALLLDVHRRGDASRFALRGDARYQLRGSRVPEKAAAAEHAARRALLALEQESEKQLLLWLQALGARSLEAIVRMWLDREEHVVLATLAPARGLGKLIVEDPEADDEEGRVLVLLVPRKTAIEPKLWEGEAERNGCGGTLVFAMGESGAELAAQDTRVIGAAELARWLIRQRIGVRIARFEVPVLDADLIESIGGLDT